MDLFARLLCLAFFALASAWDDAACALQYLKGLAGHNLGLADTVPAVDISFDMVENSEGEFCYNPTARTRADYISYDTVSTRTQCQDLCETDAKCNFYGWYEGKSKCGSCHLYESCEFRRQSACTGSDKPVLYKKSHEDTARDEFSKAYAFDLNNHGRYCDGSEIMIIPEATIEECHGFCSRLSDCWFLAHYRKNSVPQKDEDVKSDSCSIQCRLFKDCTNPKFSVCRPNPAIYAAAPPEPFPLPIGGTGLFGGVAIRASARRKGFLRLQHRHFERRHGRFLQHSFGIPEWLADLCRSRRCGGFCPLKLAFNEFYFSILNVGIFDSSQIYAHPNELKTNETQDLRFAGGAAVDDIVVFAPHAWDKIGMFNVQKYQDQNDTEIWEQVDLPSDLPFKYFRFVGAVVVDGLVVFCPYDQDHVVTFDVNTQQVQQYAMEIANDPDAKFLTGTAVGSKVFFAPATVKQVGVFDVQDKTFALAGEEVGGSGSVTRFYSAAAIGSLVYFAPELGGNNVLVFNTENNETEFVNFTDNFTFSTYQWRYNFGATHPTKQTAISAPDDASSILLIRSPRP